MSNSTKHKKDGAIAAGSIRVATEINNAQKGRLKGSTVKVAISALLGCIGAALPDFIEPADHPNHRCFFHSLLLGGILTYGAYKIQNDPLVEGWIKEGAKDILIGYGSHLLEDATTPKGLPITGIKL